MIIKNVTVFCASSAKIDKAYFDATEELAKEFIKAKVKVIYGGGAIGLMGKLADTIIEHDGKIKGIMPEFMKSIEWSHINVKEFEFTKDMHERKAKLLKDTDGLVALPGGSGTLEELLEAITLKRLGLFNKPIVILNTKNFYGPLKEMLEKCVYENFMNKVHLEMWKFVEKPSEVLPNLENSSDWNKDAINFAVNK